MIDASRRSWAPYPEVEPFGPTSAAFNLLIGTAERDPISGTPSLRSYLCEIRLAAEYDGAGTMSPIRA
jgi:hypothetical protein